MNFKKWGKELHYYWFIEEDLFERRETLIDEFGNRKYTLGKPFGDLPDHTKGKDDYLETDLMNIAENMLLLQNEDGSWEKNLPIRKRFDEEDLKNIYLHGKYKHRGNLDNGANWKHLRVLARVFKITKERRFRVAAQKCLDWILKQQNGKSGAWENANHPYITYNDDVTQGVLVTLQDILVNADKDYKWVDDDKRREVEEAYTDGIRCVLRTQHKDGGWGQQHSHEDFEPCWARSYEGPWLSTRESATVVQMLQRHLQLVPDLFRSEVKKAIADCVDWLRSTRLIDGRWPRFVFPGTTTPVFCDREGRIYATWEELPDERRYGYGWFVVSPAAVVPPTPRPPSKLEQLFAKLKRKNKKK